MPSSKGLSWMQVLDKLKVCSHDDDLRYKENQLRENSWKAINVGRRENWVSKGYQCVCSCNNAKCTQQRGSVYILGGREAVVYFYDIQSGKNLSRTAMAVSTECIKQFWINNPVCQCIMSVAYKNSCCLLSRVMTRRPIKHCLRRHRWRYEEEMTARALYT